MNGKTIFIGFGSNLGERQDFCDRAVTLISLLPSSQMTGVSSVYDTEPIDSDGILGPSWFYNGVVRIDTKLTPHNLLNMCQEVERALGRDEDNRNGPRTMDLDLLFYGQCIIDESSLKIPHPRLHLRRFVLAPLVELDPDWHHPVFNQTVSELLNKVRDSSQVRRLETVPGSCYGNRLSCSIRPVF